MAAPAIPTLSQRISQESDLINSQQSCPLYQHLPTEIRSQIFKLALLEYDILPAPSWTEDVPGSNLHWVRPDFRGPVTTCTALLRTCKRIYLETYYQLPGNRTHMFWHSYAGAEPFTNSNLFSDSYFRQFTQEQLALLKSVRICMAQYHLEENFQHVSQPPALKFIEKLTVTIRRGDWWDWQTNGELMLQHPNGSHDNDASWRPDSWGSALRHLSNLQEFVFELESTLDKQNELQELAESAKKWRFPMTGKATMDFTGEKETVWRGPMCLWPLLCPKCGREDDEDELPPGIDSCEWCSKSKSLFAAGLGPQLIIRALTYKLVPYNEQDERPRPVIEEVSGKDPSEASYMWEPHDNGHDINELLDEEEDGEGHEYNALWR